MRQTARSEFLSPEPVKLPNSEAAILLGWRGCEVEKKYVQIEVSDGVKVAVLRGCRQRRLHFALGVAVALG